MADPGLNAAAAEFLYREALLLDQQRWEEWLALYAEDAVFWVPSYNLDGTLVTDPEVSVNLMYLTSRSALDDRIFRLNTNDSVASTPVPRTAHMITNVLAEGDGDMVSATASFQVSCWGLKRGSERRAGRYEYDIRRQGDDFQIAQKKILLVDEVVDGWFDFFSV